MKYLKYLFENYFDILIDIEKNMEFDLWDFLKILT